jgi:hypothetical protein
MKKSVVVDFRFRCSLSAGLAVSLLGQLPCGVSPVQRFPQESSTFRFNQLSKRKSKKNRTTIRISLMKSNSYGILLVL